MRKDKSQQEQKVVCEVTKKIEQNDLKYFKSPNIQHLTSQKFSDYKWTIIHLVVWHNRIQILAELLKIPEIKDMINQVDTNCETPLHLAFFDRKFDCANLLLENGAKFDVKNYVKQRPVDVVVGMKEKQIQFLNQLTNINGSQNEDMKQMFNMLQRKVNKIKKLSQNEIDEQNDVLMTISDVQVQSQSNQLLEMDSSIVEDIPLEAIPNQIFEFKTQRFIQILDYFTSYK